MEIFKQKTTIILLYMDLYILNCILSSTISLLMLISEIRSPHNIDESVKKMKYSIEFMFIRSAQSFFTLCIIFNYFMFWVMLLSGEKENIMNSSNAIIFFGLIACVIGKYYRNKAKEELGKFFTYEVGVSKGQKLIKDGLYSYLMHPSYSAIFLIFFGNFFLYSSMLLYVPLSFCFAVLIIRIKTEERALLEGFGKEFEEYRSQRWRMIPFIY